MRAARVDVSCWRGWLRACSQRPATLSLFSHTVPGQGPQLCRHIRPPTLAGGARSSARPLLRARSLVPAVTAPEPEPVQLLQVRSRVHAHRLTLSSESGTGRDVGGQAGPPSKAAAACRVSSPLPSPAGHYVHPCSPWTMPCDRGVSATGHPHDAVHAVLLLIVCVHAAHPDDGGQTHGTTRKECERERRRHRPCQHRQGAIDCLVVRAAGPSLLHTCPHLPAQSWRAPCDVVCWEDVGEKGGILGVSCSVSGC